MNDFRLLVNLCVREALSTRVSSRRALSRFARDRALEARVTGSIGLAAADIARSLASGHRRRLRKNLVSRLPYVRVPFVRVPAASFHFDPDSGKLRLSLRRGEWCSLVVPVSDYHRRVLANPDHRVTQVHVGLWKVILLYARRPPEPYAPTPLVALDTNESSLDGVTVDPKGAGYVRVPFPEIRAIQARHVGRRRHLSRKKAHDRRVSSRLLGKEGQKECNRIRSRLHALTRSLIDELAAQHAVLALEDLTEVPRPRRRRSGSRNAPGFVPNPSDAASLRGLRESSTDSSPTRRLTEAFPSSGWIPFARHEPARDVVKYRNTEGGWGPGSTAGSAGGLSTAS